MIGGKTGSLRFFGAMWKSDNSKWPRQIQLYILFLEAFDVFVFPPPHHHRRHPAPTLTEKICVHSCRPARWSESDWRGGRVKTQAGVPFCWPESGSSHVLLQHSQQHHTVRQKVKGRQVISHTHTQHFAAEKKTHLFSPSPSSSASLLTSTPFTDTSAKPTCVHSRANDVKVNGPLIPPETTTKETWSDSGAFE